MNNQNEQNAQYDLDNIINNNCTCRKKSSIMFMSI